jgi:hypothetical protein
MANALLANSDFGCGEAASLASLACLCSLPLCLPLCQQCPGLPHDLVLLLALLSWPLSSCLGPWAVRVLAEQLLLLLPKQLLVVEGLHPFLLTLPRGLSCVLSASPSVWGVGGRGGSLPPTFRVGVSVLDP